MTEPESEDKTPEFEDERFFVTLKKDDPTYTAIGRMACAWAILEFDVERAIWELAGTQQNLGACITAQIFSAGSLFKAYIAPPAERRFRG